MAGKFAPSMIGAASNFLAENVWQKTKKIDSLFIVLDSLKEYILCD
jgi:hypothetical protein